MAKSPCPRCGSPATPNARGSEWMYCRRCGGLVPSVRQADDDGPYSDDPVQSAIAKEAGYDRSGRVLGFSAAALRGGLR